MRRVLVSFVLAAGLAVLATSSPAATPFRVIVHHEVKGGKIAFKVDKAGIIHASIGRVSFTPDKIAANSQELINAIIKAKPATSKGTYLRGLTMASSMSPGIAIDTKLFVH